MTGQSELYYLRDVLGIDGVIRPHKAVHERLQQFLIYTPFSLSEKEIELVNKMLSAIEVANPIFLDLNYVNDKNVENDTKRPKYDSSQNFGICFGLKPPENIQGEWLELSAISQFFMYDDKIKLEKLKRHSWQKLKEFKAKIDRICV
ncbi:MAG: hypothetical protein A2Z20_07435 [Bdellovibrionales bacterium RBG_16_40_8]|nr:MAG: hypothetical protein A2Z20_07435 [Bdellovibrionales bacterium RBG_16_40_8]